MKYHTIEDYLCVNKECMLWDWGIECDDLAHQRLYYRVYNEKDNLVGYSYEDNNKFIVHAVGGRKKELGIHDSLAKANRIIIAHAEIGRVEWSVILASEEHLDYELLDKLIDTLRKYGGTIDYYGFGINIEKIKQELFDKVECRAKMKEVFREKMKEVFRDMSANRIRI